MNNAELLWWTEDIGVAFGFGFCIRWGWIQSGLVGLDRLHQWASFAVCSTFGVYTVDRRAFVKTVYFRRCAG